MTGRKKNREERLMRQRDYQREYRRKMKERKIPNRDDIARAFLYHAVMQSLGRSKVEKRLMLVLSEVEAKLTETGFDATETRRAINDLLERYEDGWSFQRKLHLLPGGDASIIGNAEGDAD